ncbi:ABC transporter substrate-binding protein [Teichococcus oryzae]|uniref:ABC transporter substrate-binding protein n=1 Tax=Teichococcus oryzae TaxID=1608942 RepID=A0A5B2TFJ1_9PROT|nr:ABC transporter substrate-binding protein [Pseudoroseomonas oryzae]KAA2212658.1 ABC transporter substrate-binding protein [Pseudoroseomonas oryzae]
MPAASPLLSRRALLGTGGALLAAPRLAGAQGSRVLRFVPQADLAVLDPVFTTASVTVNHGLMVFDTLYGWDKDYQPQPQMAAGHRIEDDGLTWIITLRDGLTFHDGERVLARDCVASIRRWGARDMFGQEVIARSDEITAVDDKTIRFRLKKPFPRLAMALGKSAPSLPVIMPERLAKTPATTQVTEMVGSGPYRFLANERMAGARVAYARFEGYVPTPHGTPSRTAGPKIAHFDRVEWNVIPDQATAAGALMNGEVDWVETTSSDLAPMLGRSRDVRVSYSDELYQTILRFNHLHPPFNNPGVRRALLGAINQEDMMQGAYGTDPRGWKAGTGVFTSDSPMSSDAGLAPLQGKRDYAKVKRDLAAAGYNGEKIVMLQADDYPTLRALAEVSAHVMRECGMNVETQSGDWGTVSTRRANREDITKGGWSAFCTGLSYSLDPSGHLGLRANGDKAWFGWPTSPELEALRQEWFGAEGIEDQKRIGRAMQEVAMQEVPYIPLGEYRRLQASRTDLTGFPLGAANFWGVRRG